MLSWYSFRFAEKGVDDGWGYYGSNPVGEYNVLRRPFYGVMASYLNITLLDSGAMGNRATVWTSMGTKDERRAYYYSFTKKEAYPTVDWFRNHGFSLR